MTHNEDHITTVADLCHFPGSDKARYWYTKHNERGFCGCSSCDAYTWHRQYQTLTSRED